MLLKRTRENNLSPNYEPDPYKVIHKDGNAVTLEDANGNSKTRNIAHMKKFVEPETAEKGELVQPKEQPQPCIFVGSEKSACIFLGSNFCQANSSYAIQAKVPARSKGRKVVGILF